MTRNKAQQFPSLNRVRSATRGWKVKVLSWRKLSLVQVKVKTAA